MVKNKVDTKAFCGTLLKHVRWYLSLITPAPSRNRGLTVRLMSIKKKYLRLVLYAHTHATHKGGRAKCSERRMPSILTTQPLAPRRLLLNLQISPRTVRSLTFCWGTRQVLLVTPAWQQIISHVGEQLMKVHFDSRMMS